MAMTLSNPPSSVVPPRRELSVAMALRHAWIYYIILLFVPFLAFIGMIWSVLYNNAVPSQSMAMDWFIGCMAYLAVVVPAAIFWRSHVFRSYWRGQQVSPSAYLSGMLTVWIALEIGGILSLVGCIASNSVVPGLLPAAVAFILFTPLWPSGRAMLETTGNSDDPAKYAEPH